MAEALLVDMSLPISDGAVIATISAKRDGKNRATEKTSLGWMSMDAARLEWATCAVS
jgi:hypothetical protein